METMKETPSALTKLIRWLHLIQELQAHPNQTPESLFSRLGIAKATFYRDRKELEAAGYRWSYDRNRNRFVAEGPNTPPLLNLTPSESIALVLAIRQFSASGDATLLF